MSIAIRFYEESDAESLNEAAQESTAEVYRWLPWCHPDHSIEDASRWISEQVEARSSGTAYEFVITSEGGRFLGGCGLNHVDDVDRRANLGYWVRTSATGQGVARQATVALARWAFAETNLERLEIVVAQGNVASQRVAESVGATCEGVARRRLLLHGHFHDALVHSIVRSHPTGD